MSKNKQTVTVFLIFFVSILDVLLFITALITKNIVELVLSLIYVFLIVLLSSALNVRKT